MSKRTQTTILFLIVLSVWTLVVQGQQGDNRRLSGQAISYGFVSPNTRENLQLEEAIKNLNSGDETRLILETRTVACRVRSHARVNKSLGNWADGTEPSLIFRVYADESTVRYAAATLGKNWRQKSVLYFRRQTSGKARMYVMSVERQHRGLSFVIRAVAKTLDQTNVAYRTLVPLKNRVVVYVVDLSNELQPQVRTAARRLHTRLRAFAGTGAFIGNDNDRDQAQEVFLQEIKAYESQHSLNPRCRH